MTFGLTSMKVLCLPFSHIVDGPESLVVKGYHSRTPSRNVCKSPGETPFVPKMVDFLNCL